MARPQRIEYEGAVYHVTARGNDRRAIFEDDADREHFLRLLGESVGQFDVRLYLYCLMGNHVHLVLETPHANLGRFMHRLQTAYTVRFNPRHQHSGHVMQGRYRAWLVETDAYMLRLSRYVHLNPVFTAAVRPRPLAERLALLRSYPWSSYRAYIGRARAPTFLDLGPVLAMMTPDPGMQRQTYCGFVESGIEDIDAGFLEIKNLSVLCLGSAAFRARVQGLYQNLRAGAKRADEISFRRRGAWRPAEEILAIVCRYLGMDRAALHRRSRDSFARAIASRMLCDYGGLTQRQIAEVLDIGSGGAVGKQLQKLAAELAHNTQLRRQLETIAAECQPKTLNS
jgi:REP element-mobilizing transposase RayT